LNGYEKRIGVKQKNKRKITGYYWDGKKLITLYEKKPN
tara:strand:- start:59 stop:172 length:114 start_codon:yes stop_codon:yes gene_type:complete